MDLEKVILQLHQLKNPQCVVYAMCVTEESFSLMAWLLDKADGVFGLCVVWP